MNGWTDKQIDTLPVAELATKMERWLSTNVFFNIFIKKCIYKRLKYFKCFYIYGNYWNSWNFVLGMIKQLLTISLQNYGIHTYML